MAFRPIAVVLLALALSPCLAAPLPALAEEAAAPGASAGPGRTPRSGEAFEETVLGNVVSVPARDRRKVTWLNAAAVLLPGGPDGKTFSPQGGLYLWRAPEGDAARLRAIVAGIANEVRWDRPAGAGGTSFVLTLDSTTLPWNQSEYVDGGRVLPTEMKRYDARAGFGMAWRRAIGPGGCENALDLALTLEPGALWFSRGADTDPSFVMPSSTFEGRLHLRLRADALERNLVELPHAGWSAGMDAFAARRTSWTAWGLPSAGLESGGESWQSVSAFGVGAFAPFPGLSERHRATLSAHAGIGSGLDRFSSFRLGSGSTWGDFETLASAFLPGAGGQELFTSRYAVLDLEYRWQAFFFLYLQLRGTLAWARLPVTEGSAVVTRTRSLPALTAGFSTGLPWRFSLEVQAFRNFGLTTPNGDGVPEKGRNGLLVSLTREF